MKNRLCVVGNTNEVQRVAITFQIRNRKELTITKQNSHACGGRNHWRKLYAKFDITPRP